MIGHLVDMSVSLNGRQRLTIELNGDFREAFDQLKDKVCSVDIKEYRERRSLDANAYAWVLINKIAERMQSDPADIYREAVRHIAGVSQVICLQTKAVEAFCEAWHRNGIAWMTETMPSKLPNCTNVVLWYGSSTYDTKQMSDLIDQLLQDAQQLGIPTDSKEYVDSLKVKWKE